MIVAVITIVPILILSTVQVVANAGTKFGDAVDARITPVMLEIELPCAIQIVASNPALR